MLANDGLAYSTDANETKQKFWHGEKYVPRIVKQSTKT